MNDKLKGGMNHVANYGAGGGLAYGLVMAFEYLGKTLTAEQAIFLSGACIWVWHRVRPLFDALYGKLLKRVSA